MQVFTCHNGCCDYDDQDDYDDCDDNDEYQAHLSIHCPLLQVASVTPQADGGRAVAVAPGKSHTLHTPGLYIPPSGILPNIPPIALRGRIFSKHLAKHTGENTSGP